VRDGMGGKLHLRQNPGYVSGDLYNLTVRSVQLEQLKKSRILIHHGFSTPLFPIGLSICQKFDACHKLSMSCSHRSIFPFSRSSGLLTTAALPAQST
jgi:hypothetical protein